MASLWMFILIAAHLGPGAYGTNHCTMKSLEITCTRINTTELTGNISATINKSDIVTVNITNGNVTTISPATFQDFINLQTLHITNSGVSNLADNAFSYSLDLQDLSLNNNALTEFNSRSLSSANSLRNLDLSYNFLNDFSDFNISYFPRLGVLNVANNKLSHLPVSLVKMLEEENEFYLVVDNNPWNCTDPKWSEFLSGKMIDAFCVNKTFNDRHIQENLTKTTNSGEYTTETMPELLLEEESKTTQISSEKNHVTRKVNEEVCEKPDCTKCSFYYCLWWWICGLWCGVIVGNIGKIRSLICIRPATYADEYTQCGSREAVNSDDAKDIEMTDLTHLNSSKTKQ